MVVQELLRPILKDGLINSYNKLMKILDEKSKLSKTTKLWVDVVIKPLFFCCICEQKERETGHYISTLLRTCYRCFMLQDI